MPRDCAIKRVNRHMTACHPRVPMATFAARVLEFLGDPRGNDLYRAEFRDGEWSTVELVCYLYALNDRDTARVVARHGVELDDLGVVEQAEFLAQLAGHDDMCSSGYLYAGDAAGRQPSPTTASVG
jgi:hypothetical protein